MSDRSKILAAMAEAERFVVKARETLNSVTIRSVEYADGKGFQYEKADPTKNAAMKRSSLDLSKALSALRKRGE